MIKNLKGKKRYILLAVLLAVVIVGVVYVGDYYRAMPEATSVLQTTDLVAYNDHPWIEFTAINQPVTKGLIIYPGGKVAPEAYAPLAKQIAEAGYKVVVVPMPVNLAVLAPNRAEKVIQKYPEIKEWYIAGHSLGGVMAAQYAYKSGKITGLVLLASYPTKSSDLSGKSIKVLSVYGSQDGFIGQADIDQSKPLLPLDTTFFKIEGGNHSQIGWYGFQKGDNPATISRTEQQDQTVQAFLTLMQ